MHIGEKEKRTEPAALTGTSVVASVGPDAKVAGGAGGQAHAHLAQVAAGQEHEELGLASDAAVVLGAALAAFGARRPRALAARWPQRRQKMFLKKNKES